MPDKKADSNQMLQWTQQVRFEELLAITIYGPFLIRYAYNSSTGDTLVLQLPTYEDKGPFRGKFGDEIPHDQDYIDEIQLTIE